MKNMLQFFLFTLVLLLSATLIVSAATVTSVGTGGVWNNAATWDAGVPLTGDDVIIADGTTVTINISPATLNSLTVGVAGSGILTFDGTAIRAVVVTGNVTVTAGGTFITQAAGSFTNTLSIGGDLTNNGTFDMSRNGSTLVCTVTFTKAGDQLITGTTPVLTRFRGVTLNKGAATNRVVANIDVTMAGSQLFIFTNGTWEQTAGTLFETSGSQTIAANGKLVISGSGNFNMFIAGSIVCIGTLTVNTSGTFSMGSGNNSIKETGGSASTAMNFLAGTINIYGQIVHTLGTFTISGANVNLYQQGPPTQVVTGDLTSGSAVINNVTYAPLCAFWSITGAGIPAADAISSWAGNTITMSAPATATATGVTITITPSTMANTSNAFEVSAGNFTFSSGTVTIGDPNGTVVGSGNQDDRTGRDLKITSTGTVNMTGGTFYIGDGVGTRPAPAFGTSTGFLIGAIPANIVNNLVLNGGGITRRNFLLKTDFSVNTLTLTSGTLNVAANVLQIGNPIGGTATNLIAGSTSSITIAPSGAGITIPTSVTALNNLTLNNTNGIALQSNLALSGSLTLSSGILDINSHILTFGNGATISRSGGSLSAAPTDVTNFGTSVNLSYTQNPTQITTGFELPASTTVLNNLIINSSFGVLLTASVTVNGTLTLTNGIFDVSSNALTLSNVATISRSDGSISAVPTFGTAVNVSYTQNAAPITTGFELPVSTTTLTNLTVNSTNGVLLNASVTVNGVLTLTSGTFTVGAHTLSLSNPIAGTMANLNAGATSSITIAGTASGISIPSQVTQLNNLTMNNANGTTLLNTINVNGTLTLTSGYIYLLSNSLRVTTIAGGSAASYVVTDGTGYFIHYVGGSLQTFPMGFSAPGDYSPLSFSNQDGVTRTYYTQMLAVTPNPLTGALGRRWYIKELTNASAAVFNVLTLAWDATNPSAQQTLINAAPCDMVANNNGATDLYYTLSTGVSAVGATVTNNPPYAVLGSIINGVWITVVQDNNALPVELSSFNCQMSGRDVQLAWETKTEKNSNSFEIERSLTGANTWTNVGSVKAGFTSNVAKQYTYTEKNLQTGKYDYRLKMVDNDGKFEYSKTIEAVITVPKDFDLSQNFPNPFNPSTKINYSLPFDSKVTLDVYNIAGEKVAQIVNEQQPAGYYSVNFSGTSLQKSLSSGIYIYRISAMNTVSGKEFSSIKKMVLLK